MQILNSMKYKPNAQPIKNKEPIFVKKNNNKIIPEKRKIDIMI
jgi:hypothetical protein